MDLDKFKAVNMAAVMDRNRVIAINDEMPWSIPEDFDHFNKLVRKTNSICIVGRMAYERAVKYKAIPNGKMIVISNSLLPHVSKIGNVSTYFVGGVNEALAITESLKLNPMIAGGLKIYSLFADLATNFHVTLVDRPTPRGVEMRFPFCPQKDSHNWIIVDIQKLADKVTYYHFARNIRPKSETFAK